ncbi:4-(cytidine 5'-diphospho)-2-C-methyl-D-erythritol kinase [Pusillimonas sp. MFBS29]|uniref:4-(cytidine 5'-diphospho)-2-C-methyl-D-erythritol kinase n=1 Tax=Pusillimonas sp. MFBS29 TaxID=2886690 RepID=UPI001D129787|nr:4-(cytidine 5'-diphospho)-2-C-methyl-D-erythritol kinase [Pusillimonas sp. MFBS29]
MALYDVPAPAKINLFLHVTGRRADGYHTLETVFRFIDLCDSLSFDLRRDGQIERDEDAGLPGLAPQDDLVLRAAHALQKATGTRQGVQIRYEKHIPAGGGLGGGSSDAATTLIALNRLWQTGLSRDELMALARPLGADVPVFIFGRPAFARGIGDVLEPVELPERSYLVVHPPQHVPTAAVFSAPDLTRNTESVRITVFADWQKINAPKNGLIEGGLFGSNDLEPVVFAKYPKVEQAAKWLYDRGFSARMSGSGACIFVEFVTLQQARMSQQQIISKISGVHGNAFIQESWACPGLIDHPLLHWVSS